MRASITTFLLDEESGAVTVDWVVLTAVVTALGVSVMLIFVSSDGNIADTSVSALRQATQD